MNKNEVVELFDSNWEQNVEKSEKPIMIMFYSPTCPHCHTMETYFQEYAEDFKENIVFGKINIVDSQMTARRYGVMGTPTFKFFCFGHPVAELVGAVYPSLLKKTIEDHLKSSRECVENTTWVDAGISGYA